MHSAGNNEAVPHLPINPSYFNQVVWFWWNDTTGGGGAVMFTLLYVTKEGAGNHDDYIHDLHAVGLGFKSPG